MREQEADNKIVRSSTGKRWRRLSTYALPIVVSVFGVVLAGSTSAWGTADNPFTPELSVSTSTTQAGAHPDVTIETEKIINQCPGYASSCAAQDLYMEQDLKKIVLHLPPGLTSDANAAPYCDPYQDWAPEFEGSMFEGLTWFCANPDALVGEVWIVGTWCFVSPNDETQAQCLALQPEDVLDWPPGAAFSAAGFVYNDRPRPGEQGHLVIIWPWGESQLGLPDAISRSDVSIKVREADQGIDTVADELPDALTYTERSDEFGEQTGGLPGQIADISMTLFGSTGEGSGHPLLTNPTFCDSQPFDASFQGYADNAVFQFPGGPTTPGSGDGTIVTDSAPYQATGCDSVHFSPKLSLSLDNQGPDRAPTISTTISQESGEATTKKTAVTFPKAFKINDKNKATFCSDPDLAAKICPDSSKIGTASASSPLLPIGQTLTGNVYLSGLTSDSIKMSILLSGFIDLRIDGAGKINGDGTVSTIFDNQPAMPVSEFKLSLEGGDKGLIKTPKVCAPQTVTSTFQSHSGKEVANQSPIDISGCQGPTLDATLTSRKPGAPTDVELDLHSQGTKLKSVTFIPARQLHWGIPKRAQSAKAKATSVGKVAFTTASGELATAFKAARVRNDGVDLVALSPRSAQGTVSELSGFTANLSRTKTRSPLKRKARRRATKAVPQSHLALNGLPQNDLTGIDLTLTNKRKLFTLRNPLGCKHPLNFVALATAVDGTQFAVSDRVRLRGRGC